VPRLAAGRDRRCSLVLLRQSGLQPRIPIYAGTLSLPENFEVCGQKKFRTDAAIWNFRETNRLAELKWERTRGMINGAVQEFEDKAFLELPMMDKMAVELMKAEKGKEPAVDERGNPSPTIP
jgi:dipeptidase